MFELAKTSPFSRFNAEDAEDAEERRERLGKTADVFLCEPLRSLRPLRLKKLTRGAGYEGGDVDACDGAEACRIDGRYRG